MPILKRSKTLIVTVHTRAHEELLTAAIGCLGILPALCRDLRVSADDPPCTAGGPVRAGFQSRLAVTVRVPESFPGRVCSYGVHAYVDLSRHSSFGMFSYGFCL